VWQPCELLYTCYLLTYDGLSSVNSTLFIDENVEFLQPVLEHGPTSNSGADSSIIAIVTPSRRLLQGSMVGVGGPLALAPAGGRRKWYHAVLVSR